MRQCDLFGKAGVAAVAAIVLLAAGTARAQGHAHGAGDVQAAQVDRIVDQGVFVPPQQCYNTSAQDYRPIGQSFTPTLPGLDFAEFYIEDAGGGPNPDAIYQVRVHSGSIAGPVLGASNVLTVADGTNTGGGNIYTTFTFPSIVPLVPGTTHYLELEQLNPSFGSNFMVCGNLSDVYGGGTQIQGGVPVNGIDLTFKVGLLVPEPSSLGLLAGAATLLLARRRRRRA